MAYKLVKKGSIPSLQIHQKDKRDDLISPLNSSMANTNRRTTFLDSGDLDRNSIAEMSHSHPEAHQSSDNPFNVSDPLTNFLNMNSMRMTSTLKGLSPSHSLGHGNSVAGSQFRIPNLPTASSVCVSCDETNRNMKKSKETIRSLKVQISRLEEQINDLRKRPNHDGSRTPSERSGLDDIDNLISKYNQSSAKYEQEITKLKKDLNNEKLLKEEALNTLDRRMLDYTNQAMQHDEKIEGLEKKIIQLLETIQLNTEKIKEQNSDYQGLQLNYDKEQARFSKTQSDMQTTINDQLLEIDRLKAQNLSLNQTISQFQDKAQIDKRNTDDSNSKLLSERDKLLEQLAAKDTLIEQLRFEIQQHQDAAQAIVDEYNLKLSQLQLIVSQKDSEFEHVRMETQQLQATIATQVAQIDQQATDILSLRTQSKQVIEQAIASSVKLCVVAPTVNVSLPIPISNSGKDNSMKLKGKVNQPELRTFLEEEVLSKYNQIFKQQTDDLAPDNETPLHIWIQDMLNNMQKSIEHHVNTAMSR